MTIIINSNDKGRNTHTTTVLVPAGPRGPKGEVTPELNALLSETRAARDAAIAAQTLAEAALAAILANSGNPQPNPAPTFAAQPSVSPSSGTVGTVFTATPGTVANGTIASRVWRLGGTSIGTGLSVTPNAAGTLTYQETATGNGGTTLSNAVTLTVSAAGTTPTPTPAPAFTTQPSISPNIGPVGTTYTAEPGVVTNATSIVRAWLLNGTSIGSGLTVTPVAAGSLTYRETATGPGGTTQSTLRSATVSAPVVEQPEPEPENPGDVIIINPGAPGVFYAQPNAYTPLNLNVPEDATDITLSRAFSDSELKIRVQEETTTLTPATGTWRTNAITGPFNGTGNGIANTATMQVNATGATTLRNGNILLNKNQYLATGALGWNFVDTGNPETAFTPPSFTYTFKGVTPGGLHPAVLLGDMSGPDGVVFSFQMFDWGRELSVSLGRPGGNWTSIKSDVHPTDLNGVNRSFSVTYTDDPDGPGGTITFFADGVQVGEEKPAPFKPKFGPGCFIQVNASDGNTVNSNDNLEVESIAVSYGKPVVTANYVAVPNGSITADKLNALVVDAIGVTTTQPSRKLTYQVGSQPEVDVNIVVGEVSVPNTGAAYKVVLEDHSTGVAVPHPNELIMTRPTAQRVTFEDEVLAAEYGSWTEVEPQGPAPVIDGIRYGCQGHRDLGNYVVFQFHYSLDRPSEPFGDVEGMNTYMRPHKWAIYDKAGTLIKRIEQPDGKPLNPSDTTPIWEGKTGNPQLDYDGLNVAKVSEDNRWYPHGTVRSTIVWRNGTPPAFSQDFINQHLPVFNQQVPYAGHSDGTTNGFDLRIYAGTAGTGQSNGFGNWKLTPLKWGVETYESIQKWAQTTLDPYKNPYKPIPGLSRNSALWLEYTPFNSCGRSPIAAPGGTRDDRQIIPEPVALYMSDVNAVRPHDHAPLSRIALDYMTSYASEAYHGVEGGRLKPLYKGQPRRGITLREHYYGGGDMGVPANSAFYVKGGRLYETVSSLNPTTVPVPSKGATNKRPYFGWYAGDQSHAHQFPGSASMLWKDPTFAMMQVPFSDVCRMYNSTIIATYGTDRYANREKAWLFMHAAMLWKFGSKTSSRLYDRDEILEWVVPDLETFSDTYLTSNPGFLNPPSNVMRNGQVNVDLVAFAAAQFFGPVAWKGPEAGNLGLMSSAFQIGYWLSALHAAHKIGFLDAIREKSAKAGAVIDFLIGLHRKRVTGMLNGGMLLNPLDSDYEYNPWPVELVEAAGGNVGNLPQTFADAATATVSAPSWDARLSPSGSVHKRDHFATTQLLAAPSLLFDMGLTGDDLDEAEANATAMRQQKIDSEEARPIEERGSGWFVFDHATNQPARRNAN